MFNLLSLTSSNFAVAFSITISACVVVILAVIMFFMWWVDVKKRTVKSFFAAIANGIYRAGKKIGDFFSDETVSTVYSNKALNYSGTEFLPIPSKAPSSKYTYEFLGWEKCGFDENGDIVVKAIYLKKTQKCYINAYDDDRTTLLKSFETEFGAGIDVSGLHPEKPETKEFSYEFVGFDKDVSAFYKNENIYAVYKALPKMFTYKFLDSDEETIVCQGTAIYGTPIQPPSAPVKQNENGNVYVFMGWKNYKPNEILTKNSCYIAEYKTISQNNVLGSTVIDSVGEQIKVDSDQVTANVYTKETSQKQKKSKKAVAPKMDFVDEITLKKDKKSKKMSKESQIEKPLQTQINENETVQSQGLHKIDIAAIEKEEYVEAGKFAQPVKAFHEANIVKPTKLNKNSKYQKGDFIHEISAEEDEDMQKITPLTAKKTKDITKTIQKPEKPEPSPFANILVNKVKIDKKK